MAYNAGCCRILVQTGYGDRVLISKYQRHTKPDYVAADLPVAVEWICQQVGA